MNDSATILELVLNNTPQGVFWKDRDSVYQGCNRVVCRTLGLSGPEQLIGKTDFEFPSLTREQAETFIRGDREVMRTGQAQPPVVEAMNRFDGTTIFVETIKVPLKDNQGRIIGVLGTWQDVTSRQASELALRHSEQRYRSLVTAIAEMVWSSGSGGQSLEVSPPLNVFTGLPESQIRGALWLNAVHPDDRDMAVAAWSRAIAAGTPYDCQFRLRRADGDWRHIHSRGIPIVDPAGTILEWVGVGVDVTDRCRSEDQIRALNSKLEQRVQDRTAELQAANRELEAFSYSVSHDLRAPLRAIDGFSRIVLSECGGDLDPEIRGYLQDIRTNTLFMGQLIDALLAFSRLGRQPVKKQRVNTRTLVERCVEALQPQEPPGCAPILVGALPDCWADPTLLGQVWRNLLSNALKYSAQRAAPRIEIGSQAMDSALPVFYVRDNGVGFDMRYAHKLFGVFQRLHRAEDYEGTGVGLATVQRIIHRHGGKVWAEAEPDCGATFFFTLPDSGDSP